jgi:hypothetical protein
LENTAFPKNALDGNSYDGQYLVSRNKKNVRQAAWLPKTRVEKGKARKSKMLLSSKAVSRNEKRAPSGVPENLDDKMLDVLANMMLSRRFRKLSV